MSSYNKARTDDYDDDDQSKCQKFKSAIYNERRGTCFGRTPKSWGLIFIFYLIYYSCLSGFFMGMMSVFLHYFVPNVKPMRTGFNSLLTFTPGVNANPRVNESALIMASSNPNTKTDPNLYYEYIKLMDNFFKTYFPDKSPNGIPCKTEKDQNTDVNKFCLFDKTLLGACADPKAELDANRLCLYLKINKIYGWLPQIENQSMSNDILLECKGQNPGDVNNLGTPVYSPNFKIDNKTYGRISNMHFPFVNQLNYTAPMVAVQFPDMIKNLAILVECSLKNIQNFYKPVRFEIMLLEI